ncbi:MAG: prephenate dehydratase [Candidatus Latescibacteria bacterium]|nr:prephenate dehydratase [Candidatus Latescibacterota bacterium]
MKAPRIQVAFQGALGAYSELAAREFFPEDIEVAPEVTFDEVFEKVEAGAVPYGIVPIENSLAGSIHQNYDLLLEHKLWIVGEIKLRIVHHLIVHPGVGLADLRKVVSHPQALSQCRDFLRGLEGVEAVPVYDTAGAVRLIREEKAMDTGAIASAQAAEDYGLEILESGIESNHENFTRFLIVARERKTQAQDPKTSIVFSAKNIPGALFKSLSVFALRDIDLLKIESRPLHGSPWQYLFYLDFEGDAEEERCQRALGHLEEIATFLRILGSYEKGKVADGRLHKRRASSGRRKDR